MLTDIEVDDPSAMVSEHDKTEEHNSGKSRPGNVKNLSMPQPSGGDA